MITSRLKGGLGNQMFQIAAGYAHAKNIDDEFIIDYNITHHGGQGHPHLKYKDNLFKNIPTGSYKDREFVMYNEPAFRYVPIEQNDKDVMIDGYFQSELYFKDYRDDILNLFTFPDDITSQVDEKLQKIKDAFKCEELVCVHVRRGEYLKLPHIHPAQSAAYYKINMNKFNKEKTGFVVISDDMEWCEATLNADNVAFCNTGYDYSTEPRTEKLLELIDLYLSSKSDHNIIPNSSFVWWCAWLNQNDNKVYAPATWFGPEGPQDYDDIYCKTWETS